MRTTVNIDADAYDFAYAYAHGKGITLGAAMSELIRKAENKAGSESVSPALKLNEYGYYEIVGTGHPITPEKVKEFLEDPVEFE